MKQENFFGASNEDSNSSSNSNSNSYSIPPTPFLIQSNAASLSNEESNNTVDGEYDVNHEVNNSSDEAMSPFSSQPPKTPPQPSETIRAPATKQKLFKKSVSFQCDFKGIFPNRNNQLNWTENNVHLFFS
jgi:hypothetical protein